MQDALALEAGDEPELGQPQGQIAIGVAPRSRIPGRRPGSSSAAPRSAARPPRARGPAARRRSSASSATATPPPLARPADRAAGHQAAGARKLRLVRRPALRLEQAARALVSRRGRRLPRRRLPAKRSRQAATPERPCAASHAPYRHHRDRHRAGLHLRGAGKPAEALSDHRLSGRRRRDRTGDAGLRRGPVARLGARRDRRHPAHVRRRHAFFAARPAVGAGHRHSWRPGADRRRHAARLGAGAPARLVGGRRAGLRAGAFCGEHGGAPARAAGAAARADRPRADSDRLAHRRGHRDGARPRRAAADRRAAQCGDRRGGCGR